MEAIKTKYTNFLNSLGAFEKTIAVFNKKRDKCDEDEYNALAAGVIHHFEMVYEATWKFLKEYLIAQGIDSPASSKSIFQFCYKYKILPEEIANDLIKLIDDRNRTTHTYNQELAVELCNSIMMRYNTFEKVKQYVNI